MRVGLVLISIFWVFGFEVQAQILDDVAHIETGVLVFKLKPGAQGYARAAFRLQDLPFKAESIEPIKRLQTFRKSSEPSVLQGIFKVQVAPSADIPALCDLLLQDPDVAYAEPVYKDQLFYVPSDPAANVTSGAQDYLRVIDAYDAWDITQGSEEIIIGVIDTGGDLDHEDLQGNFYVNEAEEINGIDDDGNGYIDDRIGYDFADGDGDAQSDGSGHGSRVGGLAAADTDNGVGMAGLGFRSKHAPLKGFLTETSESAGNYEAIIYAADNGYDVINLSWGSVNTFSQFNQDIIDYAVLEHDVVVIAAAGNNNEDQNFYPAAYAHVLSVAATRIDDTKSSFATYGNHVDISAPGSAIYTTNNDNYGNYWGSSFASPIVAGVAGLVRAEFPELNAEQVMERIRVTSDNIDDANPDFIGKLGRGRLNAFRALSETELKSVRVDEFSVTGQNDLFYFGDSIFLTLEFKNYLDPISNGRFWLSDLHEEIDYASDTMTFGALGTLQNYEAGTLAGIISSEANPGSTIDIRVSFADGDYEDFQQIALPLAPDYLDIRNDQTFLTVAGNGEMGWVESGTSGSGLGLGLQTLASEIGLILSTSYDSVADNAPVLFGTSKNSDFVPELSVKPYTHEAASHYAYHVFQDQDEIGLKVEQSSLAWEEVDSALVVSYRISNTGERDLDTLGVGLLVNWDIGADSLNRATWDGVRTAFTYDRDSALIAGYRVLAGGDIHHAALDITDQNRNESDILEELTDSLKHRFTIHDLDSAGFIGDGNDVAQILSSLEEDWTIGESRQVVYLFAFATHLERLHQRLDDLTDQYERFLALPPLLSTEVSCSGAILEIDPPGGEMFHFYRDLARTDTLGMGESLTFGPVTQDTVIYLSSADSLYEGPLRRINISLQQQFVNFEASTQVVYLGEQENLVSFTDKSIDAISWQWDFGNGTQTTLQNPSIVYSEPGIYTVNLQVETAEGCRGQVSQTIEVLFRPDPLGLTSMEVCWGEDVTIAADEGKQIRIYAGPNDTAPVFEGGEWRFRAVMADTVFYLAQVEGVHESLRESVDLVVHEVMPSYDIVSALDEATLDNLWLINQTTASVSAQWVVNDQSLSGDTIRFPVSNGELDISLTIADTTGCEGNTRDLVTLEPAPLPTYEPPLVICRGDTVTVAPGNGTYFGFFEAGDPGSIRKGQSITFDSLTRDIALNIFGIDDGLAGDTLQVRLTPNAYEFKIIGTPDTLFLDQARSVAFSIDTTAQSLFWFINEELVERVPNPILAFDSAATYVIGALGTDAEGCQHQAIRNYLVMESEPIVLSTVGIAELRLYPNPVKSQLHIESGLRIERVALLTIDGKMILSESDIRENHELDVSHLPAGIYLIRFQLDDRVLTSRFVKE